MSKIKSNTKKKTITTKKPSVKAKVKTIAKKKTKKLSSEQNINEINLSNEIMEIMKKDKRFVKDDGNFDKVAFYKEVNNLDELVLSKLMKVKSIKEKYFKKVGDNFVFDKSDFLNLFDNVNFLGDSWTRFRSSIGLIDKNEKFIIDNDDVVLSFPFKDCVLEFDSTDTNTKREEHFINERIAKEKIDVMFEKKVFSNATKVDKNGEKKCLEYNENDNMLINGNNLIAMYAILPKYKGKIKLMYWDILYNTGGDKGDKVPYNDSFKHSSWLVMMKNRLEIAKKLLRDDGVICLQCDDNEMAYLKVLCDEIFGRDKFQNCLVIETGGALFGNRATEKSYRNGFVKVKDYILIYSIKASIETEPLFVPLKNIYDTHYFNYLDDSDNKVSLLSIIKSNEKIVKLFNKYNLKIERNNIQKLMIIDDEFYEYMTVKISNRLFTMHPMSSENSLPKEIINKLTPSKGYLYNNKYYTITTTGTPNTLDSYQDCLRIKDSVSGKLIRSGFRGDLWKDFQLAMQNVDDEGGENIILKNGKKPEQLLYDILYSLTKKGDIVLDAYFGTGTTGSVAMKMGRRFIGIEQLDEHFELAKTRLTNVINGDKTGVSDQVGWEGGGSFVYVELAKLNKKYEDKLDKLKYGDEKGLKKIFDEIFSNAYLNCYINANSIKEQEDSYNKLSFDDKKQLLKDILDKNQLYINYMDMDDKEFNVTSDDKKWTNSFYK